MSATHVTQAWSCTVRLVVDDERVLRRAARDLTDLLARIDAAASRFRPDSALSVANARAGRPVPVPKVLVELVDAALDAAADTDGRVDPTLGLAMHRIGYDRDIEDLRRAPAPGVDRSALVAGAPSCSGGWRSVRVHREAGLLTVPRGFALDLGATAKAWTADRAARELAVRHGTGVLVELGGDVAVAGHRPDGWRVRVAEREDGAGENVTLRSGGLTTSTTVVRQWRHGGRTVHHVLDPRTGRPTDGPWRTATVAARSAFAANVGSTAALVLGDAAPAWLDRRGLPARLVGQDGSVCVTSTWPSAALVASGAVA